MRKLLLVLVAMLLVSGSVLAQDVAPEVYCGDLAEEDCAVLVQSQAAMTELSAVAFDLQIDVSVTGVPDMDGPVVFALTSEGAYSGDPEVFAMMSHPDMAAMQDPVAALTKAVEALRAFDADLSFTLSLPSQLVAEDEDIPESITLELLLVDGLGYLNLEPLAPLFENGSSQVPSQGWLGLDIASLIEAVIEQNPDMFEDMEMFGVDASMYGQFSDPTAFAQYATITRTDDGSGDTATFDTTFDFAGLVQDPEFRALLEQQIEQQIEAQGGDIDEEEFEAGFAASQMMLANSVLTATSTIDLTTGYQTSATFSMVIDTTELMAMAAEESDDVPEVPPVVTFNLALNLSQFNDVAEIVAPAGAVVIPFESMLGMASPEAEATDAS